METIVLKKDYLEQMAEEVFTFCQEHEGLHYSFDHILDGEDIRKGFELDLIILR